MPDAKDVTVGGGMAADTAVNGGRDRNSNRVLDRWSVAR
jgi:hypothetical protein